MRKINNRFNFAGFISVQVGLNMYALRISEMYEYTDVASAQCVRSRRNGPPIVRVDASLINLGVGALLLSGGANPDDEHDR